MLYESAPLAPQRSVAGLEDYLEAIRRRRLLVAACLVGALALGGAFTRQREAVYEARANVLVNPTPAGGTNGNPVAVNLDREVALILGDEIKASAAVEMGHPADGGLVTASFQPGSDVIVLEATSDDPEHAAELASSFATAYVERRLAGQAAYYADSIASIDIEVADLAVRIDAADAQISTLDADAARWDDMPDSAERSTALADLADRRDQVNGQRDTDTARRNTLLTQRTELVRNQTVQPAAASVISAASVPARPAGLPDWAFWAIAGVLGLLGGVIAAFLLERLDRSAQTSHDIELAVGRPVLGSIPRFGARFRRGRWALVMANDRPARSLQAAREAYRRLRSSTLFLARADDIKVIVVTSSQAVEGKSTTAGNLAAALALGGSRVALVSADLRRPSVERLFELDNRDGVADYLSGTTDGLRMERITGFESLTVLPSGPIPTNPGELLASRRFGEMLGTLRAQFDVVIVDTPPLQAAADALAAAAVADGVILVVDGKRTETTDLLAIRNDLDRSGVRLLGAVANRDRSQRGGWRRRRGTYSYYATAKQAGRAVARLGGEAPSAEAMPVPNVVDPAVGHHGRFAGSAADDVAPATVDPVPNELASTSAGGAPRRREPHHSDERAGVLAAELEPTPVRRTPRRRA